MRKIILMITIALGSLSSFADPVDLTCSQDAQMKALKPQIQAYLEKLRKEGQSTGMYTTTIAELNYTEPVVVISGQTSKEETRVYVTYTSVFNMALPCSGNVCPSKEMPLLGYVILDDKCTIINDSQGGIEFKETLK